MPPYRVLVIGGYGFFGRRLVERLSRHEGLHIIAAGRSATQADSLIQSLRRSALSDLGSATIDTQGPHLPSQLAELGPHAVVLASGPFQGQQYGVAKACVSVGAHYIDLADGREFVAGIGCLQQAAVAANVAVISGASSVPALSSAAVDHLAQGFSKVTRIDIGISPGNRTERGLSTVRSVLSYCGQPLPTAASTPVFGWSGSRSHRYPAPVGRRLLSPCDVPDLALLPGRYPGHPSIDFGAGLELGFLHRGMNAMAWLPRLGIVANWADHAVALKRAGDWFRSFGSDAGAMHVTVTGETVQGDSRTRTWHLVATEGDGPYVPTLAAAAVIRRLQRGETPAAGARPCVGVLTLENFAREAKGLHIAMAEDAP